MKNTMTLLGLCLLSLIPGLAAAQLSSQELDYQGESIYSKGFYAKSIPYFQQAIQADPNNAKAYEDLGNAYLKQNDQTDAIAAFQQSLQINPNNSTLKALVDSMSANGTTAPPPQTQSTEPSYNQGTEAPPAQEMVVVRKRRPRSQPTPSVSDDGLALMDHAKIWVKYEMSYNYSTQGDLMGSVSNISAENTYDGFTSGNATMPPGGLGLGGELGFLLNKYNGIAIGVRYIQANDYNYNAVNSNASTVAGAPSDFETTTFTPYVVPLTLDYYLFLPDAGGRFFLTGGIGYYAATVQVNENTSLSNFYNSNGPNTYWNPTGNLTAGNVGFQLGIGRDFAINPNFGISIFGRFRYAKITNFSGTLSDGNNWALVKYANGTVDIDNPSIIGTNGNTYATVDFTGFDIGASLNFYSF